MIDIFARVPPELSDKIASHLPLRKIIQLQRVSKDWRDIMGSEVVINDTVKRHGYDGMPGTLLQQKERMCNQHLGRPAKMIEIRDLYVRKPRLEDKYFAFHNWDQLCVLNLETLQKTSHNVALTSLDDDIRVILTDRLVGIATVNQVYYRSMEQQQLNQLSFPSELRGNDVVEYGSVLAIPITDSDVVTAFWTFDTATQTQSYITFDTGFAPQNGYPELGKGHTCDKDWFTLFSVYSKGQTRYQARYGLKIARYSRAGRLKFQKSIKFALSDPSYFDPSHIEVSTTGAKDRYCLTFCPYKPGQDVIVDLRQDPCKLFNNGGIIVWKDRYYQEQDTLDGNDLCETLVGEYTGQFGSQVAKFVGDRVLAEDLDFHSESIAINDRYLIRSVRYRTNASRHRLNMFALRLYDYEGKPSLNETLEGHGIKQYGLKWFRAGDMKSETEQEYAEDEDTDNEDSSDDDLP